MTGSDELSAEEVSAAGFTSSAVFNRQTNELDKHRQTQNHTKPSASASGHD